jgi:hypothetical protein
MELITKKDLISNVSERWDMQYRGSISADKINKGNILRSEKPQTEKRIIEIIGNKTWTTITCNECKREVDAVVQLGDEPDYESSTALICFDCLNAAVNLINPCPKEQ